MLHINKARFHHNLELTKAYCQAQMAVKETGVAEVFRSYNPVVNGVPLYYFMLADFGSYESCYPATQWEIDPVREEDGLVVSLFREQLHFKKKCTEIGNSENPLWGRIVISQIDNTFTDGFSEACSVGLFDVYDMPPVNTWFYLCNSKKGRLLFAWIPTAFLKYAQEAIAVNCVDCIGWFDEWYEADYWITMGCDFDGGKRDKACLVSTAV